MLQFVSIPSQPNKYECLKKDYYILAFVLYFTLMK